ncbi:27 kDa primary mesenchyme-specific spicule protein-like [Planococcus citri]|uniref:27 kDa primary mesenchyme-specific spicule protein-like n=1 Tax=Planococcus citri TaxID=170843 RepID=UPI0031F7EC7E
MANINLNNLMLMLEDPNPGLMMEIPVSLFRKLLLKAAILETLVEANDGGGGGHGPGPGPGPGPNNGPPGDGPPGNGPSPSPSTGGGSNETPIFSSGIINLDSSSKKRRENK